MIRSDVPPPVTVGIVNDPEDPPATVLCVSVPALLAAPNAFAICCATVRPALEPKVNVSVVPPGPPGTVVVAIIFSVLTRGRSTPDAPGA